MSLQTKIPREASGRTDKPCSSLDIPVYAPYKNGKGSLDLSLTPIKEEDIFKVDRYWPYYINQKHWLLDNRRDIVYRDINKKKTSKSHSEIGNIGFLGPLSEIEHPFGGQRFQNPNWTNGEWEDHYHGRAMFTPTKKSRRTEGELKYICYYGGPVIDMWPFTKRDKYGLEHISRVVQEDICVLRRREEGWVLIAGSVCFPSYWSLKSKMGKPLQEIHSPVPQLTEPINDIITKKLDDLPTTDRHEDWQPVERFNWTITNDMELHQPYPEQTYKPFAGNDFYVRVERQTLTKLRANDDIMFTIRTYLNPISAIAQDIELAKGLHSAIIKSSDEVLEYRGINMYRSELLEYLDGRILDARY